MNGTGVLLRRTVWRALILGAAMTLGLSGCLGGGGNNDDGGSTLPLVSAEGVDQSEVVDQSEAVDQSEVVDQPAGVDQVVVALSWDANPASEAVEGYRVYFAKNSDPLPPTPLTDSTNVDGFNSITPVVIYDAVADLGLTDTDSRICFGLQAYNTAGSSAMSDTVCRSL